MHSDSSGSARKPNLAERLLHDAAWIVAGILVLAAWSTLFSVLLVSADWLVPVKWPTQMALRIAWAALAVYSFVWPLMLLVATHRFTALNRALRAVLLVVASLTFIAATIEAFGYGQQAGFVNVVFRGTTLRAAPAGFAQSVLICLAVVVARRPGRRTKQNADR